MKESHSFCHIEALKHFAAGRNVIPCNGKFPVGTGWGNAWRDRAKLDAYFSTNANADLGLVMGDVIDIESDGPEQDQVFEELFADSDVPRTPCFKSTRGKHYIFKANARLTATGKGVINHKDLGVRIGAGGTQVHSLIPPSLKPDGTCREWTVSFEDCEPAELPESVVDRILESVKPTPKESKISISATSASPSIDAAVSAMLDMKRTQEGDGSKRLLKWAFRAVEGGLNDAEAIVAIRRAAEAYPFPKDWTDKDIVKRIRSAEQKTTRGLTKTVSKLWEPQGRTDAANGSRLAAMFGDVIRWCDPWRKWLVWDGCRWAVDNSLAIDGYAKTVASRLWDEFHVGDRSNESVFRFVRLTSGAPAIQKMISLARSEPGIPIGPDELDKHHFLLNVANGTLDLSTGELRPHRKEDYLLNLAPVEYDSQAQCPVWHAFIDKVFSGDGELIGFVKRFCGYCFTGDVTEQALAILCGGGANGKSTLLTALLEIGGDYAVKSPPDLLLEKSRDTHPTLSSVLHGKRLAVISETPNGAALAEARIKDLTGGEKIATRRMHEDYWSFDPTHKILVGTNHKPEVKNTDHAIWRRLHLVPFDVTIPAAEQDKQLPDKLRAEYPGILRWIVEGCLEWQRMGLMVPAKVNAATAHYRASEDVLAEFLGSCCTVDSEASVGASELLRAYQDYSGDWSMTAKQFAKLLRDRGFNSDKTTRGPGKGRKIWFGVQLAPAVELSRQPTRPAEEVNQLAG